MTNSAQIRLDVEMSELQQLDTHAIRERWRERLGSAPPKHRSKDLLLHAFAYALQVKRQGDLSKAIKRRLGELAIDFQDENFHPTPRASLPPGTALTREWNNRRHVVLVEAKGFRYQDKTYSSLTAVARAITGTHWSGRKFFKLDKSSEGETL